MCRPHLGEKDWTRVPPLSFMKAIPVPFDQGLRLSGGTNGNEPENGERNFW